jgi:hypothetical protein
MAQRAASMLGKSSRRLREWTPSTRPACDLILTLTLERPVLLYAATKHDFLFNADYRVPVVFATSKKNSDRQYGNSPKCMKSLHEKTCRDFQCLGEDMKEDDC